MKQCVMIALLFSLLMSGCRKEKECDCVPLADNAVPSNWKISSRTANGGATTVALTDEQKHSILTLMQGGLFKVRDTATHIEVNGSYQLSTFKSIYGEKTRVVFTPVLPMLDNEFYILLENPQQKFVLGDNLPNGYLTSFELIP